MDDLSVDFLVCYLPTADCFFLCRISLFNDIQRMLYCKVDFMSCFGFFSDFECKIVIFSLINQILFYCD